MELDKNSFNTSIKKIKKQLNKIPEKHEGYKTSRSLTKYANKLNKIAKNMNKLENLTIKGLLINFSHYLYSLINDISILFSKKKIQNI